MTPLASILCFALLGSSEAVTSQPAADSPVPKSTISQDIRVAFFVHGNRAFKYAVEHLVEVPVGEEIELVPYPTFRRAAQKAHIHSGPTIPAAQQLAHTLLLSHAISVSSSTKMVRGERKVFLEVLVVRVRPKTTVTMAKVFALPGHKLTPSLAGVIVERIKKALAIPPEQDHKGTDDDDDDTEAPTVAKPAGKPGARPGEDMAGAAGKDDDSDDDDDDKDLAPQIATGGPDAAPAEPSGPPRAHVHLGLGASLRSAAINAPGQPTAPAYDGGALGLEPTVRLELAIFTQGDGSAFGVRADGAVQLASTSIVDPEENTSIISWVRQVNGIATFRWRTPIYLDVCPEAGFGLYQFPINGGSFPGLTYTSPLAGLRLAYEGDIWHVWAAGSLLFLIRAGDEAARLGTLQQALGGIAEVGSTWALADVFNLGLLVRLEQINSSYTGQTFLFTTQRWTNVTVNDRLVQFFLTVGSQFW